MAVHVRYKSLYISFPFSGKQQRDVAEYCGFLFFGERGRRLLMFVIFIWNCRRYIFGLSKF